MFKKLALVSAAAAFAVPMTAFSAAQPVSLDVFYVANSTLDLDVPGLGSDDEDGDGWGVRIHVPFEGSGIGVHGEYQSTSIDDFNLDIDQLRLGASWMSEGNARFGVVGEYIKLTLDPDGGGKADADGFGAHGRGEFSVSEQLQFYGQVGYVSVSDSGDDIDGVEYLVGGIFQITPMFGAGVDYRYSDLEGDDDTKYKIEDLRLTARINFGL